MFESSSLIGTIPSISFSPRNLRSDVTIGKKQSREANFTDMTDFVYIVISTTDLKQQQLNNLLNSIENVIATKFFEEIPELKSVYFDKEGDVIDVWSVLSDFSRSVREKVYVKEAMIIKEFSDFVFNFRTTDIIGEMIPASSGFRKVTAESLIHA